MDRPSWLLVNVIPSVSPALSGAFYLVYCELVHTMGVEQRV